QAGPIGPPSVVIDAEGEPWVSYQAVTAGGVEVRVATPDADGWSTQVAATTALCNGGPAPGAAPLILPDGAPVVLFADPVAGEVSQAALTGNRWVVSTAVAGADATGLAAGSDGETAVASFYADGSIHVASGTAGGPWSATEVAGADVDAADRPTSDVALDDEGNAYVAWQDAEGVHMASGDGDTFEAVETQQTEGGTFPSIAVTGDAASVYLAWYEEQGQDLLLGVYGDVGELALANPSPIPPPSPGGGGADGECGADGQPILEISSAGTSFTSSCLVGPAGEEFAITYDNPDPILHNIAAYTEQNGDPLGDNPAPQEGRVIQELTLGPLDAGNYYFQCDVHPTTMQGTLAVVEAGGGGGGDGDGGGGGGAGGTDGAEAATGATPSPTDAAA
ncbi:MAG TPA: hypothetical protein VLA82_11725, partial [Actinomycetota bacterium]|nr:hypothetical protein [Actinomycetota bacterium]